jgi:hypothetical protein
MLPQVLENASFGRWAVGGGTGVEAVDGFIGAFNKPDDVTHDDLFRRFGKYNAAASRSHCPTDDACSRNSLLHPVARKPASCASKPAI